MRIKQHRLRDALPSRSNSDCNTALGNGILLKRQRRTPVPHLRRPATML
ncbi:hypothetical protein KCP77_06985 [Salmonella enterica subsp. enterica]|nr:hypothetical protein KCP77_06985 [Salmonella enterica subsp. enterica]